MSRILELAFDEVKNTKCSFRDDGRTLVINDAFIFWSNFEGKENKWKNSARTFNVAIDEETAAYLQQTGWKVRMEILDEDVDMKDDQAVANARKVFFVNIKVNMESAYPPVVKLFSESRGKKSQTILDINTIGILDRTDIKTADCVINAYSSKNFPGKVSGYLKQLYVIQEPNIDFNGKYDDWMDDEETLGTNISDDNPF